MLNDRKQAFDIISNALALISLDIKHHQAINDQSLNIHAEEFFKNVFNFVYSRDFVNANQGQKNAAYIDLVDNKAKQFVQITSNKSKEKLFHTLQILHDSQYADLTMH